MPARAAANRPFRRGGLSAGALVLMPALASFGSAAVTGCGPAPAATCGDGTPTLEIGAGAQSFLPLADGGTVFVLCGPQGGRHILLRMRVTGLGPEFGFSARVSDPATAVTIAALQIPKSTLHQDGTACVSGLFPVFVLRPSAEIAGAPALFHVQAIDPTGRVAAAAMAVTVDTSKVTCAQ